MKLSEYITKVIEETKSCDIKSDAINIDISVNVIPLADGDIVIAQEGQKIDLSFVLKR